MTPQYRLHFAPDNASLIIRLALLELDVPFETVLVDRANRAQNSAAYHQLNPVGRIPALETPHGAMFETGAILLWLADRHGALMPAPDSPSRGAALSWLFFLSNTLHAEQRMLFYPDTYAGVAPPQMHPTLTASLHRHLTLLDGQAAKGTGWLNAAQPSALDLYIAPMLRWCALYPANKTGWFNLRTYPALAALAARIEARNSVLTASRDEGLGPHPFTAPQPPIPPIGSAT
ncbi:glutathione S-transferase family protein [Puniceibacterium sediminis]|uniref:Glutathione S-transferase n=1 Tax=Puniceibacterium sediminis TaxID=1608407 RepID=A0A238UXP2_9RHOB|nr:glutathione S-transferase family protein [Puniceibacterium sediminis]SNR26113.1 glutathione S-transferase [Puniceibacterium sediminis]